MNKFALVLILLILTTGVLNAEVYPHEDGNIMIEIPDEGWETETEEDILYAITEDEEFILFSWVLMEKSDLEDALGIIDEEISPLFTEFEVTEELEEININGIPAISVIGIGEMQLDSEEEEFEVAINLLILDSGSTLTIVILAGTEKGWAEHMEEVEWIIESMTTIYE